MYILTEEYNDYSQYGEYFVAAWLEKPTEAQVKEKLDGCYGEYSHQIMAIKLLEEGGGRIRGENHWYNLQEYEE